MSSEQKQKEEPKELSAWQRDLKAKFNKSLLNDEPTKEKSSQQFAKEFLGEWPDEN